MQNRQKQINKKYLSHGCRGVKLIIAKFEHLQPWENKIKILFPSKKLLVKYLLGIQRRQRFLAGKRI